MLAEKIERWIAYYVPPGESRRELFAIAAEVSELEARALEDRIAQAQRQPGIADLERLAELGYGAGGGGAYVRRNDPPHIAGPECEEPR